MCTAGTSTSTVVLHTAIFLFRYQGLASLQVLMSTGQVRAPAVRYFVAEWRRELGVAVHCLLSTEEGTKLADTMDMFVNLVNSRLDLT